MYIRPDYLVNDSLVATIGSHLHITPDTSTEPRQMVIKREDLRNLLVACYGIPVEFDQDMLEHFARLYKQAKGIQRAEMVTGTRSANKYYRLAFAIDLAHYILAHEADVITLVNALAGSPSQDALEAPLTAAEAKANLEALRLDLEEGFKVWGESDV